MGKVAGTAGFEPAKPRSATWCPIHSRENDRIVLALLDDAPNDMVIIFQEMVVTFNLRTRKYNYRLISSRDHSLQGKSASDFDDHVISDNSFNTSRY